MTRLSHPLASLALLCGVPSLAQTDPYSTSFTATENPISEGGIWFNGGVDGVDWGNVQTDGTHAFGVSLPSTYADPSAALKGSWAADQTAQAVVKIVGANPTTCCHELELRLRTAIAAHDIKGYEINFSVTPNTYVQIVRWNGPLANSSNSNNGFTYIASTNGPGIHDGDVLRATIRGNTITVYQNGAQILQGVDTGQGGVGPWTSGGAPGIGFFDNIDTNWSNFGFASFTGSDSAANLDGGRDAGSGPPDAGNAPPDGGSVRPDGGSGRPDAGGDSGTPGPDSGSSGPDASTPTPDAGASNVTGGGCGCSGTSGQLAAALALLCLVSRRRTRVLG